MMSRTVLRYREVLHLREGDNNVVTLIDPQRICPERTDLPDGKVEFVFPRTITDVEGDLYIGSRQLTVELAGFGSVQIVDHDATELKLVERTQRALIVRAI